MAIRNFLIAATGALALSALAGGALAAGSVQATANATLTILSPTTITKTQDMVFGQIVRPTTGSDTVVLDTGDTVTINHTGGGNGSVVNSTTSSAKFNITSSAADTYTTTQTLTFTQAGLTNIAPSAPVASSGTLGQITGANGGTQEIRFGGQFDISAATTAQTYTGTLTVTVNYN